MLRRLIPDYDFVENMSEELFDEFISLPEGLPMDLMSIVREVVPDLNRQRAMAIMDNPNCEEIVDLQREERAITHSMRRESGYKIEDALNFHTQYALDFLDKYPQFKPMIKGVEIAKP